MWFPAGYTGRGTTNAFCVVVGVLSWSIFVSCVLCLLLLVYVSLQSADEIGCLLASYLVFLTAALNWCLHSFLSSIMTAIITAVRGLFLPCVPLGFRGLVNIEALLCFRCEDVCSLEIAKVYPVFSSSCYINVKYHIYIYIFFYSY